MSGATGFLGGALARRLQAQGAAVTALGRNPAALAELERAGMRALRGDLADLSFARAACQGQELVFHCAALSSAWGPAREFYRANVLGTRNLIAGCEEAGVTRLVHVSTPSIYFRYAARLDVAEDAALPARPVNEYARSKLLAEAEVDRAFARGLAVITIRPRAIFGAGDTAILPRIIRRLQSGRLRVIGDGRNIADLTCVENVVDALLLCADAPAACLGKKYNITNGEPQPLWELIGQVCARLGLAYPRQRIAYPAAMALAAALELVHRALPGQPEPLLTRYMVSVLAQSATLDIRAARRELNYTPRLSVAEGFERFARWWQQGGR